eukprot:CAMPEP_0170540972 /NCGR_PEP_ID=MMETSP0211-20121228/847_1 /TAXON_ID=311385 /ORGANISM="Pseudokeronopsis sp., Strain OXSARD2" /LENGTH=53 /DNA_ID=CAMNT_0010843547 /DNA_START=1132 /DNA_END=1293 /DNA_ORIENTATION=-
MKVTSEGKERWQTLYELGQKKKEEKEQIRQTYLQMKEDEELNSLQFKPQITMN